MSLDKKIAQAEKLLDIYRRISKKEVSEEVMFMEHQRETKETKDISAGYWNGDYHYLTGGVTKEDAVNYLIAHLKEEIEKEIKNTIKVVWDHEKMTVEVLWDELKEIIEAYEKEEKNES